MIENIRSNKTFILVLIFIFISMYILNRHSMLITDDYGYSFAWGEDRRISSLGDILFWLQGQYFTWGGRTVVHFFALLFLSMDKYIFDIVNSLVYTAFLLIISFHALGKISPKPALLLILHISMFAFLQAFGQDLLWLDGACNYLWGATFVIAFLLPYRLQLTENTPLIQNKKIYPSFFLFAIIAAWTNENLSVTALLVVFLCIVWHKHQFGSFLGWQITGFLGALIGSGLLLLAPGNYVRLATQGGGQHVDIIHNFFNITKMFFDFHFLAVPIILAILLLIFAKNLQREIVVFFAISTLTSMYAMAAAPFFPDRSKIGTLAFFLAFLSYIAISVDFTNKKKTLVLLFVFLLGFWGLQYTEAYKDITAYESRERARIQYILDEKAKGNMHILVDANTPSTRFCAAGGLEDIDTDENSWINKPYAKYYGVQSVKRK